jgi:ribosomal protein S18 acetylase RimI-like enzyme
MGIGAKVFEQILEFVKENKKISLQVNRKNFKSINFYFKQGFTIEYVKDFEIGNGYLMEDFIMTKPLNYL